MLKIVLDTNMFISGFIFHGMIKAVFGLLLENKLQMYISPKLKAEVTAKFKVFSTTKQEQDEMYQFLEEKGVVVKPKIKVTACRDPKDNFVLELAETVQAKYIITRDKDLLELKEWKNTEIIKPEDFLPILRTMKLI